MNKVFIIIVLIVLISAFFLLFQRGPVEESQLVGECMVWNESGTYLPMLKLCSSQVECEEYVQEAWVMAFQGVVEGYDWSNVKCEPATFIPALDKSGDTIGCTSNQDCFSRTGTYNDIVHGDVVSGIVDSEKILKSVSEVFRCSDGLCEITSGMGAEVNACAVGLITPGGCSYFESL